jgi:hypothetical protein
MAIKIWENATKNMVSVEKDLNLPYLFHHKTELFALDALIVAKVLGINKNKIYDQIEAFSIFYLTIHLLDDVFEDPQKFLSNFSKVKFSFLQFSALLGKQKSPNRKIQSYYKEFDTSFLINNNDLKIEQALISFLICSDISIQRILNKNKNILNSFEIQSATKESEGKQINCFYTETYHNNDITTIFKIKNEGVSGESTSLIADFLNVNTIFGKKRGNYIKKALYRLGSLTQFTDDLRDYENDKRNENANIIVSLEKKYGKKKALEEWGKMYSNEEIKMKYFLSKAKIYDHNNILNIIPFFFLFQTK